MFVSYCSEEHSVCHIETANLDGETNLKIRQALPATAVLSSGTALSQIDGHLLCDLPNRNLYDFNGTLRLDGQDFPLGSATLRQIRIRLSNISPTRTLRISTFSSAQKSITFFVLLQDLRVLNFNLDNFLFMR